MPTMCEESERSSIRRRTARLSARVRAVEAAFPELVLRVLPALAATGRHCPCPRLMERYRLRGDLGADWRTWVR